MSEFTAQAGDSGVAVIKAPVSFDLVRAFIAQVRQSYLRKQRRIEAFIGDRTAPGDVGGRSGVREGGCWCEQWSRCHFATWRSGTSTTDRVACCAGPEGPEPFGAGGSNKTRPRPGA
jgi:hypothetical protein